VEGLIIDYGITDQFTVIGSPEFGGRYRLLQADSRALSGQATMRVSGTNDTSNPAAIGYAGSPR
jgi:hypothetical protein